jgi:hypothetical protein
MGVHEAQGQLGKGIKDLLARWADTKMDWDDANSRDFEKNFLAPLEQDLKGAIGAMDVMGQLLHQARRDCE